MVAMPTDDAPPDPKPEDRRDDDDSAASDLAKGIGLLFSAAKKAVKSLDNEKLDDLQRKAAEELNESADIVERYARKAVEQVETLDKEKVKAAGTSAVKNLHPKKVEAFAHEASQEILNVVDRVSHRVEETIRKIDPDEQKSDKPSGGGSSADAPSDDVSSADKDEKHEKDDGPKRVRVEED